MTACKRWGKQNQTNEEKPKQKHEQQFAKDRYHCMELRMLRNSHVAVNATPFPKNCRKPVSWNLSGATRLTHSSEKHDIHLAENSHYRINLFLMFFKRTTMHSS